MEHKIFSILKINPGELQRLQPEEQGFNR